MTGLSTSTKKTIKMKSMVQSPMKERESMNISKSERALIISALEGDRQGTWGDKRSESIKALLTKLKREGK